MSPKKILRQFIEHIVKNLALVSSVVIVLIILVEVFNPFNLSVINKVKDLFGVNRQTSSELQEIVAGELVGRSLLADATREYSGDLLLEKRGGVFNCAGEQQLINGGIGTARVIVEPAGLTFTDKDNKTEITVPKSTLDTVDLEEDIEIVNKRNACVRLVQIFGDVTSESDVREQLRKEIEDYAKEDSELFREAECKAEEELKGILSSSGVDLEDTTFIQKSGVSCS